MPARPSAGRQGGPYATWTTIPGRQAHPYATPHPNAHEWIFALSNVQSGVPVDTAVAEGVAEKEQVRLYKILLLAARRA